MASILAGRDQRGKWRDWDQRIEVQPIVTLQSPVTAGPPITPACQASVEVFDHLTERTWTYQSTSVEFPALQ